MIDLASLHHPVQLSAGASGTGLLAVGIVVALLLLTAVWWGIPRCAAEPPPGAPSRPTDWRSHHVEEHREPDPESFPDGGERLSPHEMNGYGNLGSGVGRRQAGRDEPVTASAGRGAATDRHLKQAISKLRRGCRATTPADGARRRRWAL